MLRTAGFSLLLASLASCSPGIVPEPGGRRPAVQHVPPPRAPTPPPPAPLAISGNADWLDWPVTPGAWSYARSGSSSIARFGSGGVVQAWVRCDLATHAVAVGRSAHVGGSTSMMRVRTTFGTVEWPAQSVTTGVEAVRGASDPGLDQIAFSRGRFALLIADQPGVIAPTWAEPVRVVEDCRG